MKLLNLNGPQAVMALMVRRKWWIIVPFVGLSAAVTLLTFILPKMYVSQSRILIRPRDVPTDFVKDLVSGTTDQRLSVIAQTVLTRDNLVKTIRDFDLPEYRNVSMDDAVAQFGKQINLKFAVDQQIGNGQLPITSFQISYQNQDREMARKITEYITSLFLREDTTNKEKNFSETVKFLQAQVDALYTQLTESDKKLSVLRNRRRNELPNQLDANLRTADSLRTENQSIANSLIFMRDRLSDLEKEIEKTPEKIAKLGLTTPSPAAIVQNQKIMDYRTKQRDLKELKSMGYTLSYPRVATLTAQVQSLEKELTSEELAYANGEDKPAVADAPAPEMINNPAYERLQREQRQQQKLIEIAVETQEKNDKAISTAMRHIENTPKGEEELSDVNRDNLDLTRRYQEMKDKLSVALLSVSAETAQKGQQFVVVETPVAPSSPAKPVISAIIGVGMLASLLIGLAFAIIVDIGNQKMWTHADIEALLGATVLVEIPEIVTPDDLLAARKKRSSRLASLGAAAVVYAGFLYFVFLHQAYVLWRLGPLFQRLY